MNDDAILTSASPTQCDLILDYLQARAGRWVPMPELAATASAYAVHSRIADLRAAGHVISVKIEGIRPRKSFYRLEIFPTTDCPGGGNTTTDAGSV